MANTYLSRTQANGTSSQKFTVSCWVKRSGLGSPQKAIFTAGDDSSSPLNFFGFNTNDQIAYWEYSNDTTGISDFLTTRRFRDTNAWYHIVLAVDTTQATASNRIKLYVNGVQETDVVTGGNNLYPQTQNQDLAFNDADGHYVGRYGYSSDSYFDGLMSHFHFIDGTAYTASTFGSTDSVTGEWKINTSPSVTYGTNGFFILKDGNSVTDQSGNSNNFTVGGGTLTKTEDSPSNVFATINPLSTPSTLSNGTLRCIGSTTYKEFKNYFEKDRALVRRFQKIDIKEPSKDEGIKILQGLKGYYEKYHGIKYSSSAIISAVELSSKYIGDRKLPDKAIDVLDEAGGVLCVGRCGEAMGRLMGCGILSGRSLTADAALP